MGDKTFHIANFGCRVSHSEGAAIHAELISSAIGEATSPFDADVLIINSCTVTDEADRDVRRLIRRVGRRSPSTKVVVTGCYAQRRPEDLAGMPGVRFVVGNSHKGMVGSLVLEEMDLPADEGRSEVFCSEIFADRSQSGSNHCGSAGRTRVTVKVQDGCNATCSFCIIPTVRGPSRSRGERTVIAEVEGLVERGYREVVFSGIHLGAYGRDTTPRSSLASLIRRTLDGVPALERLRLSSIEPLEVTDEIIGLVASDSRVASHLHIPLQSGSSRILREMRRPYGADYYAELVGRVRAAVPDAAIGADVMVGFPGETDDDFEDTCCLVRDSPLTYLHVFPYSPRPGTAAAEMKNPIPAHVVRFRGRRLRELIAGKNREFRGRFVGRELSILVLDDKAEEGWRPGISDNFIKVRVPDDLSANRWHRLAIAGIDGSGLEAFQDSMTTTAADTVRS